MKRSQHALAPILLIAACLLAPTATTAQELYTFTAGVLGTLGGSLDSAAGDDLSNLGIQLNFTVVTEPRTHVGLRLGRLGVGEDDRFGTLADADLTYLTVGGEYRFDYRFYESGVFAGLGAYRTEGTSLLSGGSVDDTGIGVVLGVTGEFAINRRFGILLELAGHWADLDQADTYLTGHAGLVYHF